jgi:hypothetical protein
LEKAVDLSSDILLMMMMITHTQLKQRVLICSDSSTASKRCTESTLDLGSTRGKSDKIHVPGFIQAENPCYPSGRRLGERWKWWQTHIKLSCA